MLCGSSYADAAIIVIDVQKSIEEQTKRPAFILQFLEIGQIILVFNKIDLSAFNKEVFNKVKKSAIEVFKNICLLPGYFIPISAKQGDNLFKKSKNMLWYKGLTIIEAINTFSKKARYNYFRFPIQYVYNTNKGDKIAVGEVISGRIRKGEKISILPLNKKCKLKEIRGLKKNRPAATAPQSVGLILDDMNGLSRGQIVCKGLLPSVTTEFMAKIFCVCPIKIGEILKFRCVTQEQNIRIKEIKAIWDTACLKLKSKDGFLKETDIAEVVIIVESPVVVEKYKGLNNLGRFIILNGLKEICAAGIIP